MLTLSVALLLPVFIYIPLSNGIQYFAADDRNPMVITPFPQKNSYSINSEPSCCMPPITSPSNKQLQISPSGNANVPIVTGTFSLPQTTFSNPTVNQLPFVEGTVFPIDGIYISSNNIVQHPAVPDIVQSFALPFIQSVQSDQNLFKAFQFQSLSADEVKNIMYDIVHNDHSNTEADDPTSSAHLVSESLASNYGHVTPDSILRFYAYTPGKYMFYHGLLTPEAVRDLSEKYVNKMRDNLSSVGNLSPEAAFRAIAKGFIEFMKDFGLYRKDNAHSFATYFSNELHNLSKYRTNF